MKKSRRNFLQSTALLVLGGGALKTIAAAAIVEETVRIKCMFIWVGPDGKYAEETYYIELRPMRKERFYTEPVIDI